MIVCAFIRSNVVRAVAVVMSIEAAERLSIDINMDRAEDVTALFPRPLPGWIWVAGEAPHEIIAAPERQRYISSRDLYERFTEAEREALVSHTATAAQAFVAWLKLCGAVDLDHPVLVSSLNKAVNAGILSAERPNEIRGLS